MRSAATREIAGTGLWLAITGTIIESVGGRIRVERVEGAGTAFTVEPPVARG